MSDEQKPKDPSAIVLPFGKHKGKTVAELLATDAPYADWITTQGWVAERFAELHAAIITRGSGSDDTPEHNALQARFLDEMFRNATVSLARDVKSALGLIGRRIHYNAKIDFDMFEKPRYGWVEITPEQGGHAKRILEGLAAGNLRLTTSVAFENRGVDVIITMGGIIEGDTEWHEKIGVELKPSVGDDYPTVLRQMKRLGATILVVGQYTGRGISESQLRQIFAASEIKVVFVQEIEEAMRGV